MYKFLVCVQLIGNNSPVEVKRVKDLFTEALHKHRDEKDILKYLSEKLETTGFPSLTWNPKDKSYFLMVSLHNRETIVLSATYVAFNSLRNITAFHVAFSLSGKVDFDTLEIPKTLKEDMMSFCKLFDDMHISPLDGRR